MEFVPYCVQYAVTVSPLPAKVIIIIIFIWLIANYLRQGSCVMPSVCLSMCLLATLHKIKQ